MSKASGSHHLQWRLSSCELSAGCSIKTRLVGGPKLLTQIRGRKFHYQEATDVLVRSLQWLRKRRIVSSDKIMCPWASLVAQW